MKNIPYELKKLNQWVGANNSSKIPLKIGTNYPASSVDSKTWSSYTDGIKSLSSGFHDYLGFVFDNNGYVGIDLDKSYINGKLSSLADEIITICNSYTEISKSGNGIHIIVKGDLPFLGRNNLKGIEIYKDSRFFIMTGKVLFNKYKIKYRQEELNYILKTYFAVDNSVKESKPKTKFEKIYKPIWNNVIQDKKIKVSPTYPIINQGGRNVCMTSVAGFLYDAGYSPEQLFLELNHINSIACVPPLSSNEIKTICKSISRYRRKYEVD